MKGVIMKTTLTLILISVILCFIAGCGPGQPFEMESSIGASGHQLASAVER